MKPGDLLDYNGTVLEIKTPLNKTEITKNYIIKILYRKNPGHLLGYRLYFEMDDDTIVLSHNWLSTFCTPITNPKQIQALKALFL